MYFPYKGECCNEYHICGSSPILTVIDWIEIESWEGIENVLRVNGGPQEFTDYTLPKCKCWWHVKIKWSAESTATLQNEQIGMVHSVGRRRCSRDLCGILLWMNRNRLFVWIAISVRDLKSSQSFFWISSKKSDGGFNWLTVLRKILVLSFRKILDGGSRNCKQLTRELKRIWGISVAVALGDGSLKQIVFSQCAPLRYLCHEILYGQHNGGVWQCLPVVFVE